MDIPDLDRSGLRRFGLQFGALVAGIFGVLLPWLMELSWPLWPWLVGGLFAVWSLLAPQTLKGFYRAWMGLGLLLARVVNPLVLGLVYLLVFTPVAGLLRLFGKDPMRRRLHEPAASYRVPVSEAPGSDKEPGSLSDYENPF